MTIYPLEFYRRAEEKWKRRAGALRTDAGLPPNKEGDGILVQWPVAARNRARTSVRVPCLRTSFPERSRGAPEEACKIVQSLRLPLRTASRPG
jgi:hypothetical protein